MTKLLVTGDRNWTDLQTVRRALQGVFDPTLVIHGDAKGADRMAGLVAQEMGLPVKAVPADWLKYGRAAGPIRNKAMLELGPDLVIAFHDDLQASRGTRDMVNRAAEAGVPVLVFKSEAA